MDHVGSRVVVAVAGLVLLVGVLHEPGGGAEDHAEAEAAGPAEAGLLAAGEAVVVEGLQFLGLAAPGGAAEEVAAEAHAADLEAVAPEAPAAVALTHRIIMICIIITGNKRMPQPSHSHSHRLAGFTGRRSNCQSRCWTPSPCQARRTQPL